MLKQVEKPTQDDEDALVGNEEIKEEVRCVCLLSPPPMMFKQNASFAPFSELQLQKPMPHERQGICRCVCRDSLLLEV